MRAFTFEPGSFLASSVVLACGTHPGLLRVLLLALALGPGVSQAQTSGIYATDGGYVIEVEFAGDMLTVVEPNKRSEYTRIPGTSDYEFTNVNNHNIRYGMRVIDARTLGAYKPDHPGGGLTMLTLRSATGGGNEAGASPGAGVSADTPASPAPAAASAADRIRFGKLAAAYQDHAQRDPANVQAWTACSAAAYARATSARAEADDYAFRAAASLKPIMMLPDSPCPDVISPAHWHAVP